MCHTFLSMLSMKRLVCSSCKRPATVCYCHTLKEIENRWPVHILQHPEESKHAIGTARIALLSLAQCVMPVGECFDKDALVPGDLQPLLVYPGDDSSPLVSLNKKQPRPLIFVDASWRKSRRMLLESPALMELPKVSFQPESISRYRIRKVPDRHSLSTLEAIVYALSFLEEDNEKYQPLLASVDWMIDKQIELMGRDVFEKNYP